LNHTDLQYYRVYFSPLSLFLCWQWSPVPYLSNRRTTSSASRKNHRIFLEMQPPVLFAIKRMLKKNWKPEKILASYIEARCTSCHNSLESVHYFGMNPFTDPLALQQYASPEKILAEDQASCIACHSPHAAENNNRYRLTKEYLRLAAIARSINPHRQHQQPMCLSCHSTAPVAGQSNLAENGNINALCNRCHATGFARKEIHPVGIIPSKHIRIPPDMPLQNGLLTCETCHQSSLQPGNPCQSVDGKKENKKFLRGGELSGEIFVFSAIPRKHINV